VTAADALSARRWKLLASAMVSFFAVGTMFFAVPPLADDLRASFGLTNLAIGVLMGAIAVPAIVLSIPLGVALDRWPARAAGLAGLAIMLVGAITFALAPSYGWLLAGRLLFGIGGLLVNLLLARLLSLAFAGQELALAMGLFTGVYPASMIALFTLHPWLVAHLGWRGEMGLLVSLVVVALPLHAAAVPGGPGGGPPPAARPGTASLPAPLVALGLAWMLYFAAFAAIPTFAPAWAGGGAGGLLVTSAITWVALAVTPAGGWLIDRTGHPDRWCFGALGLLTVTLAVMALGQVPPLAAMAAAGLAAGIASPAVYALPGRLVSEARVGFAFGFITALSNLGTVIGPTVAGAIRDATPRWSMVWGALGVVALAGTAAAAAIRPPRALASDS